jgi:hypothetical protein
VAEPEDEITEILVLGDENPAVPGRFCKYLLVRPAADFFDEIADIMTCGSQLSRYRGRRALVNHEAEEPQANSTSSPAR